MFRTSYLKIHFDVPVNWAGSGTEVDTDQSEHDLFLTWAKERQAVKALGRAWEEGTSDE
jgi:hypothetical protein